MRSAGEKMVDVQVSGGRPYSVVCHCTLQKEFARNRILQASAFCNGVGHGLITGCNEDKDKHAMLKVSRFASDYLTAGRVR
jgi:hypothetical protein